MHKTKKILSLLIIIILTFVILFVYLYSFNEAKKLAVDQAINNKNLTDLEIARQKLDLENRRLSEIRGKSYIMQVSQSQYLKTKALVDRTNIFFKDADTLHPQIQIKTKNKIIEEEINTKRLKINELLLTWAENNRQSLETDQALINQIKVALLYIQSYTKQLQTIVSDLSIVDSGLSTAEINSYRNIVTENVTEITKIITTVNQAEALIKESDKTSSNNITEQIEIVRQAEEVVTNLQNIINNVSTTTASSTAQNSTSAVSITTSKTSTSTETRVNRRPRIVNPEPAIIYQPNPAPFRDTGVDIDTSGEMSPLQDW